MVRIGLVGPGLAVTAVAGFLLGACGGGDGSAVVTRTGVTATRPAVTATLPAVTVPTPTVTVIETEAARVPTAESSPTTTAVGAEPTSTDGTPWGWIALALVLIAALVGGIVVWRRRGARATSWSTQHAELSRRCLVALDSVLADGSVVTGQIEALASEARSLETHAPDDPSREAARRLRARLDELARTLGADRTLRLGSPPPSTEQLSYSTALIREQARALQGVLRPPDPGAPPPWN